MKKIVLALALALSLEACPGAGGPQVATVSAVTLGAFDLSLYGWDARMDADKLKPGSAAALRIARDGRAVLGGYQLAHIARQAAAPDPALDALYDKVVAHAKATFARLEGGG
jgi:hypothetical protein